jgi:hypothetical protein
MSFMSARYHQLSFKASHNSYERKEKVAQQLAWYSNNPSRCGCRGLELDINRHSDGSEGRSRGYFKVSHFSAPFGRDPLAKYLEELRNWHSARPGHHPIFVTLDIKSKSGSVALFPSEIDTYLSTWFGRSLMFSPARLIRDPRKNLCANVIATGWPSFRSLRGKFIFCLSGTESWKSYYASFQSHKRLCFADRDVKGNDSRVRPPTHGTRAIFNLHLYSKHHSHWSAVVPRFRARNLMTRGYVLNGQTLWKRALAAGINILATDKVSNHSWALVANRAPFRVR